MTEPLAWPEVDEDLLDYYRNEFDTAANALGVAIAEICRELSDLFGVSDVWRGSASDVAMGILTRRVAELDSLRKKLVSAESLFRTCADDARFVKRNISTLVGRANETIARIRASSEIAVEIKSSVIQAIVSCVRNANYETVAAAASEISGIPPIVSDESEESPLRLLNLGSDSSISTFVHAVNQFFIEGPGALPGVGEPLSNSEAAENAAVEGGSGVAPEVVKISRPMGDSENGGMGPVPNDMSIGSDGNPAIGNAAAVGESGYAPQTTVQPSDISASSTAAVLSDAPSAAASVPNSANLGTSSPPAPSMPPSTATRVPSLGSSPLSSSPSTPTAPGSLNPAAAAGQSPVSELSRAVSEASRSAVVQPAPMSPVPSSAGVPAAAAPPLAPPPVAEAHLGAPAGQPSVPSGGGAAAGGASPPAAAAPTPAAGPAPAPAVPLGPPPTPSPAAPITSAGGGVVAPSAAPGSGVAGTPSPVPVSAARAERDAMAAAATAGALRRKSSGRDPLMLARRVGAALNVGESTDFGFFWVTGLTTDGVIVVANSYGIGFIPEGVDLPEQVVMVSADESVPVPVRARWATYPVLALQGWAAHHGKALRAVIATEPQFEGFDPGVAKVVLVPDDIPASGQMQGRSRLAVIAPAAAALLVATADRELSQLLPAAGADSKAPEDRSFDLWWEVSKPLLSKSTGRVVAHLEAFAIYAEHAEELALHRAHIAADPEQQRAAVADWSYWQNIAVLISESLAESATK